MKAIPDLLLAVTPFLGPEPWVTDHSRQAASRFLDLTLKRTQKARSEDLVASVLNELLDLIKPRFASKSQIKGSKVATSKSPADWAKTEWRFEEAAEWEKLPGLKFGFLWCMTNLGETDLVEHLSSIAPPMFRLLDDYRVSSKLTGIKVVGHLLSRLPAGVLKKSGLVLAISAAVSNCLHFREQPVLSAAYPCLFELIEVTEAPLSTEYFKRYEELFLGLLKETEFEDKQALRNVSFTLLFGCGPSH